MKKVLILGANGMAGHVLTIFLKTFPNEYEVKTVARENSVIKPDELFDITNFDKLESLYHSYKPDFIINAIGVLNSYAEDEPAQAILINGYLPHYLELLTKSTATKVVHISTDCVFSGKKGAYTETDFKDGVGFYASTKAVGELNNMKDLTIRTSIIGPELKEHGIGLFHWFMKQESGVKGYKNAIWSGLTTLELAKVVKHVMSSDLTGLIHAVNNESISKYDLLHLIQERFGKPRVTIDPDESYAVNKSLLNTREDFNYTIPSYSDMLLELKEWYISQSFLYAY